MFLKSRQKDLLFINGNLEYTKYKLTTNQFIDICDLIRRELCWLKEKVRMCGDIILSKFTVGSLIFKESIAKPSKELKAYLETKYSRSCNEYFVMVIDFEVIIFYVMAIHKIDYENAARNLKLLIHTSNPCLMFYTF